MKLRSNAVGAYCKNPSQKVRGVLIYGADAMDVATYCKHLITALIGPDGKDDMRLNTLSASDLKKDPACLTDALKETGFFPGDRAVVVDGANESIFQSLKNALEDWQSGDARMVVTASQLTPRSKIRKMFEDHPDAYAAPVYETVITRDDIKTALQKAHLNDANADVHTALFDMASDMPHAMFAQVLEKLSLYKHGDPTPLTVDDVLSCVPFSMDTAVDEVIDYVAQGDIDNLGTALWRLSDQGVLPVTLCIMAARHFKMLYTVACDVGGASAGLAKARPPVYGPRRAKIERQLRIWTRPRLEQALSVLYDTDLQLRSPAQTAPANAVIQRALIRLGMLAAKAA